MKLKRIYGNRELNETTSEFNFPIVNFARVEIKEKDTPGISSFTSTQNINKYINQYSCRSRAGNQVSGTRKTNQDSYLANTSIMNLNEFCIFGVYDGHGNE